MFDMNVQNILPWLHLDTHLQNDRIRIFFFVNSRSSFFKGTLMHI